MKKISFDDFSRAYTEEYYYVLLNQKMLVKHPDHKIRFATRSFLGYLIASGIFVFAAFVIFGAFPEFFPVLFIPVLTLVATAHTYYRIRKNVVDLERMDATKFHFTLTEKHISFGSGGSQNGVIMLWEEVKKVIYTENSIIFLPNSKDIFPIVVPISAKKDVKAAIKKYNIK